MQIRVERFLAITALLASTTVLGSGCVTDDDTGSSGGSGGLGGSSASGGTGGTAGGSAGSAGASTGGTAGSTGGTAGASGSAGSAGDAGVECLGDTAVTPDAGGEGYDWCAQLPYLNTSCPSAESLAPLGVDLCYYMDAYGRDGVVEELVACLATINETDQCGQAHADKVQGCINTVWPQACPTGPITIADGGTYDICEDLANSCPAVSGGTAGVTKQECIDALSPFTADGQYAVGDCYNLATGTDCAVNFEACVFNF